MTHLKIFAPRLRDVVLWHMIDAIESQPVQSDPYPHFQVSGFFPVDVYQQLLELLPNEQDYQPFSYDRHSDENGSNRKRFKMNNSWLGKLCGQKREFWYAVRAALGSPELKECVFEKLKRGLAYRFSCDEDVANDLPGFALPELFRETASYTIKPHPDTRKKVVTMQLSLASDDSLADWGTEIYRRSVNPASWLREPYGFDVVKTMPYLPNTAYAFVVLNTISIRSWHGRTALKTAHGVRNTLLNIWYRDAERGCTDLYNTPTPHHEQFSSARIAA